MPIYEYMCADCGERFDLIRSMKEADSPINCQNCKSLNTSRLISVFYAQSGSRVLTREGNSGCSSCSSGSCSSCRI